MEKMKNKIKETFLDKNLYIFSMITILFFGVFCIMQYAPDTYSVFATNLTDIVSHFFSCGRIVTGAALYIVRGLLHRKLWNLFIVLRFCNFMYNY